MADSTNLEARNGSLEADAQRLLTGQAWREFCDRLKAIGDVILREDFPRSGLDRAEGYRHLTRLLTYATEACIENSDPDFPHFSKFPNMGVKLGMDNPDTIYLSAPIRGDATYQVTGKRGTVKYLEFQIITEFRDQGPMPTVSCITSEELEVGADGSFELILGAEPHPGNWLPLELEAKMLLVRQTFDDWDSEEAAELRILQVGKEGEKQRELEPGQMAKQLDAVTQLLAFNATHWHDFFRGISEPVELQGEIFDTPSRRHGTFASESMFSGGYFDLADDQALIIKVAPSDAIYWGFQLGNCWYESLDYANRQTSLNGHQSHLDSDGVYRFVIAHKDPGVPNWLDTAGHRKGSMLFRWTLAASAPTPMAQMVKFDEIWGEFPEDTPHIDEHTRRQQIARRQAHVSRRYNP